MSEHTPEPWEAKEYNSYTSRGSKTIARLGSNNCIIAKTNLDIDLRYPRTHCHNAKIEANARRIVACVNACEGISTEVLEGGELDRLINTIKDQVDLREQNYLDFKKQFTKAKGK